MGRGKRVAREIALSNSDGRRRLVPAPRTSLPSLGLRVTVADIGDGYPSFSEGERPVFRLRDDEQVVLVYGQEGRTLIGNLGIGATSGALLARLMREGHTIKGEVANQGTRKPIKLELLVEVY
jgi:hypothetical protein